MIGVWQLVLILAIVLVLFGAGRVPKIMKDIGSGLRAFKEGIGTGDEEKIEDSGNDANKKQKGRKMVAKKKNRGQD